MAAHKDLVWQSDRDERDFLAMIGLFAAGLVNIAYFAAFVLV